ncbi:unnamed protein product [Linum trigynum]|uniref:DUF4283 domain-containing protein n=1 Tax=Linum trigynum TaxID=586398 RepID=A0AAV2G0Z6_9ROSI
MLCTSFLLLKPSSGFDCEPTDGYIPTSLLRISHGANLEGSKSYYISPSDQVKGLGADERAFKKSSSVLGRDSRSGKGCTKSVIYHNIKRFGYLWIWKPPDRLVNQHIKGTTAIGYQRGKEFKEDIEWNPKLNYHPEINEMGSVNLEPNAVKIWVSSRRYRSSLTERRMNSMLEKKDTKLSYGAAKPFIRRYKEWRDPLPRLLPETNFELAKNQILFPPLNSYYFYNKKSMELSLNLNQGSSSRGGNPVLKLAVNDDSGISMLVGKMMAEKSFNYATIKGAVDYSWSRFGEIDIRYLRENKFVFSFPSEAIRERVWMERPWILSNTLVALKKWDGGIKPEEVEVDSMAIWVQIHDLPQKFRSEENLKAVAGFFFGMHKYDKSGIEFNGWRRYVRFLVEVELNEPIPVGFDCPWGEKKVEVVFKYEKLGDLCYYCGRISHQMHSCRWRNTDMLRGGSGTPSGKYSADLKANRASQASPIEKNRKHSQEAVCRLGSPPSDGERRSADSQGGAWSGDREAFSSPTTTIVESRAHPQSCPPGFSEDRRIVYTLTVTEFFPEITTQSHGKALNPRRLDCDLEKIAVAMEARFDLNEKAEKGKGMEVEGAGRFPFEARPNLMDLFPTEDEMLAQDIFEEGNNRLQKKRKPVGMVSLEKFIYGRCSPSKGQARTTAANEKRKTVSKGKKTGAGKSMRGQHTGEEQGSRVPISYETEGGYDEDNPNEMAAVVRQKPPYIE